MKNISTLLNINLRPIIFAILIIVILSIPIIINARFQKLTQEKNFDKNNNNNTIYEKLNCDKNFKYSANTVHSDTPNLIFNETKRLEAFGHGEYRRAFNRVYFVNGTEKNQQFMMCVSPKAGITRALMILQKIINKDFDGKYGDWIYGGSVKANLHQLSFEQLKEILLDEKIPRVAFVRDPYARAISMFKDKVNHSNYKNNLGFKKQDDVTFAQFIEVLYLKRQKSQQGVTGHGRLDEHFIQQSQHCMIPIGMKYNYILQIEKINDWYNCFINKFNIYDDMMHGWHGNDECFLSTPLVPCNGPAQVDGVLKHVTDFAEHNFNSLLEIEEFYSDKNILQKVTEMYQQDFINFDYEFKFFEKQT